MKTAIFFIWTIVIMVLSHCSNTSKAHEADYTGINIYLSDSLNIHTSNIFNTHIFFSDNNCEVFESTVKSISSASDGYVPDHSCGTYYTFIRDTEILGFFRLENFKTLFEKNDVYYFGGNTSFRGLGYFEIIKFNSSEAKKIFQSTNYIYDHSIECSCYCDNNGYLRKETKDINSDQIPDVIFVGEKCYYCDSLETGYGREDRSPHKREPVKFQFISKYDSSKKEISWFEDSLVK